MVEPSKTFSTLKDLEQRMAGVEAVTSNFNGGDGTSGGMEGRIAKLESGMEHLLRELVDIKLDIREIRKDAKSDFRWMLAGFATLLGVMAKGFGWFG